MISQPSGTVLIKKVDGNNNFIEDSLDYFDIQASLSQNVVTVTGTQTISGAKTFNSFVTATGVQGFNNLDLQIKASGIGDLDFYTNNQSRLRIDDNGILRFKSHVATSGTELNIITASGQTTDASSVPLISVPLEDNSAYWIEASVVGRKLSGSPLRIRMEVNQACAYRAAGGPATMLGAISNALSRSLLAGAYDTTIDTSGNNLLILVQGDTGETVGWSATLRLQKI